MKLNSGNSLPPDNSLKMMSLPNVAAITIFIFSMVCSATLIWQSEQRRFELEQARVSDIAGDHAHALQAGIERTLTATYSLAALVREGKGDISNFEATAREMLPFFPGAASLQLAPGGVVRQIVPLAGNEGAMGHDLFKDPARRKEAIKTRDDGKLTLAGPFTLKQGGFGAVGRMPVYLDDGEGGRSFWGFTNVLIRFPEVLEPARLGNLEKRGFRYELWRLHPDTGKRQIIAASSSAPLIKQVDHPLELPNGTWTLSVAPTIGWSDPGGLAFKSALGLVFSLLLFTLTRSLLNTRATALQIANRLTSELRASEEKFRMHVENSFDVIFTLNSDGQFIFVSPAWERHFGFSESLVTGKSFIPFVHPDDVPLCEEYLRRVMGSMQSGTSPPYRVRHADGSWRWFLANGTPYIDPHGVCLFIGVGRDITESRQVEEMLRAREEEFRAVVENSPDVIVRYDREGRRIFVNPEYERVNHVMAKEVLGKKPAEFSTELAPMAGEFTGKLMAAMESGTKTTIDLSWTKEGRPLCWYVRVVPEFDANGNVVSALTIWSDISERKQIEKEIRQLNEELEERVKERTAELEEKNAELARLNKIFVGRELRMVELKERIRELEKR